MIRLLIFTIGLGFCSYSYGQELQRGENSPRPNILFFLVDDLGYADLACYGSTFYETPGLDKLAREGIRFTQAYTAASLCSPTRASIMTGKHPARVNITDWIPGRGDKNQKMKTPQDLHNLPLSERTIGEAFGQAGYATYYAGKWHLGNRPHGPRQQGFDTYVSTFTRSDQGKKTQQTKHAAGERQHLTQYITRETIRFLTDHANTDHANKIESHSDGGAPFFAFISYHDVHTPVVADERYIEHFKRKLADREIARDSLREGEGWSRTVQNNPKYASMVRAIDQSVADILNALESNELSQNTIVLFFSDNGGLCTLTRKRGGPTSNLPLRSGKGWLYEGGIRVPLIIRMPDGAKAGQVVEQPVFSTDFYPTLLSLAGLDLKPQQHIDGVDMSPLLLENPPPGMARTLYWHFPHYHGSAWKPGAAIRHGNWKLIEFYETGITELYDLGTDVGEINNLAQSTPEKAVELRKMLRDWQSDIGAKLPTFR